MSEYLLCNPTSLNTSSPWKGLSRTWRRTWSEIIKSCSFGEVFHHLFTLPELVLFIIVICLMFWLQQIYQHSLIWWFAFVFACILCVCVCVVIITTHAVHDVLQVLESSVLCSAASCVLLLLLLTLVFCSLCSWSRCVLGSRCCGGGPEWCSAHSWRQDINVSWLFNTLFLCSCCEFKT